MHMNSRCLFTFETGSKHNRLYNNGYLLPARLNDIIIRYKAKGSVRSGDRRRLVIVTLFKKIHESKFAKDGVSYQIFF